MLPLAFALADPPVEQIPFDTVTANAADLYAGRIVKATFTDSCPPDQAGWWTVLGAGTDAG